MGETEVFDDGLTIRQATDADGERVRELVFSVLGEYGLEGDVAGTDADLFEIEASYKKRGGSFELLEDADGKLLGTVGLFPIDDTKVELRKMYFATDLRGRGLGRKLLERTIENACSLGFSIVYLETAAVLTQAVRLYRSFGFEPVDIVHSARCDQGFELRLGSKV
jgi:putative acetyltransferase